MKKRHVNYRSITAFWISLFVLTPLRHSFGQEYFRVSPGALNESHAEWDNSDGCVKCHELGGGVLDKKCLDCHEDLQKAIKNKKGMHANLKERCIQCHTQHKGRHFNITNWQLLGGRKNFNHNRTGFKLEGRHAKIACSRCHTKRAKSGRTYYPGLSSDCIKCHKGVHQFTRADLENQCDICHQSGRKVSPTLTVTKSSFDHDAETNFKLEGKHKKQTCMQCHKNKQVDRHRKNPTCAVCHQSPHGKGFSKTCTECHHPARPWKQNQFNHDTTGFPLRAEHRKLACSRCHKPKGASKPGRKCINCHRDKHRKRFTKYSCEMCHGMTGSSKVDFDHKTQTGFNLQGAHQNKDCRACHRGNQPHRFERFAYFKKRGCTSCHKHKKAHQGRYRNKQCARCHIESGRRTNPFDHDKDTRFVLDGQHRKLYKNKQCERCHPKKLYRTGKLTCIQCHEDHHKGKLGKDCSLCHNTQIAFKDFRFDHDRKTKFKLDESHRKLACEKCHLHGKVKPIPKGCQDCHQDRDPHGGKLGSRCDKCHESGKEAPKFNHETMTRFARTGAHLKVECGYCHRTVTTGEKPPEPGWTKRVKPQPADKSFPVMGKTCNQCHADPHRGRYGDQCGSCHNTMDFKEVEKNFHTKGDFRLYGAHLQLDCNRCHQRDSAMAGLGEACRFCHQEDDVHNNALGDDCGRCHTQHDWSNPRFNHSATGFRLSGAHRFALCRDCHGIGSFQNVPTDCAFCHQDNAARVTTPPHQGAVFENCEKCHNQISFSPARYAHPTFPLRGIHKSVECTKCHADGVFEGRPSLCEDCHLDDFSNPENDPNHLSAGFSTHCQDCHTPVAWRPGRYWHTSFRRRGAHLSLACQDCHPGNDFNGALGGLHWDCGQCHGPGGPINRFPHAHVVRGFPIECDLCHTQNAWLPAKNPPPY